MRIACSRLSDSGEGAKEWGRRQSVGCAKMGAGREKVKRKPHPSPQFPPVFFLVFALSLFCGPDYLGAWNRLTVRTANKLSGTWNKLLKTWKECIINTANIKGGTVEQIWRLKRIAIGVLNNLLAWQFLKVHFSFFFVTFGVMLGGRHTILSFTNNFTFNCERCEPRSHFISRLSNRPGEHSHE